jgi:uncharacterized protein (TIGR00255 family)
LLLSMTGHGEAHRHEGGVSVAVEVRTVNNRYFKLSVRTSEGYSSLEPQIESIVRESVRRGTVQINLRIDREGTEEDYKLNEKVISGYLKQLESIAGKAGGSSEPAVQAAVLGLPGVVSQPTAGWEKIESQWPLIESTIKEALASLSRMRTEEGRAMSVDLTGNCRQIGEQLVAIEQRAPLVIEAYRSRIIDRLNKLLAEVGSRIEPADVVREVGMYAERSDISEEIVRLRSHLEQFRTVMTNEEMGGRKLEFLTQEMFRETNTIGSKANDAEIARHVIEIKTAIERIREMIQNVE